MGACGTTKALYLGDCLDEKESRSMAPGNAREQPTRRDESPATARSRANHTRIAPSTRPSPTYAPRRRSGRRYVPRMMREKPWGEKRVLTVVKPAILLRRRLDGMMATSSAMRLLVSKSRVRRE